MGFSWEDKLAQLKEARAEAAAAEERAARLREELMARGIKERGAIFFHGYDGKSYKAVYGTQNQTIVDIDLLEHLMGPEMADKVSKPRAVNLEAFRRECESGRIPRDVMAQVAHINPWKASVYFEEADY